MRCRRGTIAGVILAASAFLFPVGRAAPEGPAAQEEEEAAPGDIAALATGELEARHADLQKRIGELEMEAEYLRTEPPDMAVDSGEVEATGFGAAGRVKSDLLNPRADHLTGARLEELKRQRDRIEAELKRRE